MAQVVPTLGRDIHNGGYNNEMIDFSILCENDFPLSPINFYTDHSEDVKPNTTISANNFNMDQYSKTPHELGNKPFGLQVLNQLAFNDSETHCNAFENVDNGYNSFINITYNMFDAENDCKENSNYLYVQSPSVSDQLSPTSNYEESKYEDQIEYLNKQHDFKEEINTNSSFELYENDTQFTKITPTHMDYEIEVTNLDYQEDILDEQFSKDKIDPVYNIAIKQMKKDMYETCRALGISHDPSEWSHSNVHSWIEWTTKELNINDYVAAKWNIDGDTLVTLNEKDFMERAPKGGCLLFAQLEIWKVVSENYKNDLCKQETVESTIDQNTFNGSSQDDRVAIEKKENTIQIVHGSTHIHLWQFLKELLTYPHLYSTCIRWQDRKKGVFKIEDSVKVAKLWGKRKNRPAMNYDKLSRSIRQYYKKGIMKKTQRSQRLVYQFCHPYDL